MNQTSEYNINSAVDININSINGTDTAILVNNAAAPAVFYFQNDSATSSRKYIDGFFPQLNSQAELFYDQKFVHEINCYSGITTPSTTQNWNVLGGWTNLNNTICNFRAFAIAIKSDGTQGYQTTITGGLRATAGGNAVIINNFMSQDIKTNFGPTDVLVGISTFNSFNINIAATSSLDTLRWALRVEKFYNLT